MYYRKPTFLLILLLLANALQATVIREDFARLVDYAGWRLVDAYMQDYVRLRPDMTAEKQGYRLFKETYNPSNYSISNPPPNDAMRLFLISHDWRGTALNLYDPFVQTKETYQNEWTAEQATQALQDRITAVSPEALGAQSDADYTALLAMKKQLTDEVAASFLEPTEANMLASDTTSPEVNSGAEVTDQQGFTLPVVSGQEERGTSGMFNYAINPISLGAVALLLLLSLYLLGLVKRLDTRVDNHSKRIEDLTSRLFLKKDPISAEEAKQLKSRVAELEKQLQKLPQPPPPPSGRNSSPTPAAPQPKEYYLSTPNQDGTFNASSMSEQFRPSASVFKFVVTQKSGSHWAEFTVADDAEAVKDALSSPTSYLDPVCESVNAFFPGAKRIVNERPGRALRQGDKWVVKPEQKARIRYE
ncbi:MAG: hypothetical protein WA960_18570 [Tunicatimonas sp.]